MPWAITPNAARGPVWGPMKPILTGAPSANGCVVSAGQLSVGTLKVAPAAPVEGTDVPADDSAVVPAVVAGVGALPAGGAAAGTRGGAHPGGCPATGLFQSPPG